MPRLIALETSGRSGSVAAYAGGRVVASHDFPHGLRHAANLVPAVDAVCRTAGWTPGQVEVVAVSVGPGSFTGLRVGVTLAKTLAFATGAKVVAVPTLRASVERAPEGARNAVAVVDAGRGDVYAARYERVAGEWVEREPVRVARLPDVLASLPADARPAWVVGEGLTVHANAAAGIAGVSIPPPGEWASRAADVAAVGAAMASRGGFADPVTLGPLYVRRPGPEEKRLAAEAAKENERVATSPSPSGRGWPKAG